MEGPKRTKGSGQYAFSRFERPCVCGHSLGEHSAERVRTPEGIVHECFAAVGEGACPCECFKPAKVTRNRNPARGERGKFDPRIFTENPLDGMHPERAYSYLRWGNSPKQVFNIDAPEPMVSMGELARLYLVGGGGMHYRNERSAPFLAVGTETNLLYIVPRVRPSGPPRDVPEGPFEDVGIVRRTDYYSDKGGEPGYYFHDHEKPYPFLFLNKASGVFIIVPSRYRRGRSYAVDEGGIVG